jgi:hypothetical protein
LRRTRDEQVHEIQRPADRRHDPDDGVAVAKAVPKQVPFRGAIQGQETDVFQGPPPGTLAVDGSATGVATHPGRCTFPWQVTVNLADGSASGSSQFVAANGDILYTTTAGQGEPKDTPGLNRIIDGLGSQWRG